MIVVVSSVTVAVFILSSGAFIVLGCVCHLFRHTYIKQSMAGEERTDDIAVAEPSPVYEDLIPQSKSSNTTAVQKDFEMMENVAYAVITSTVESCRF